MHTPLDYGLHVTGYRLQVAGCRLEVPCYSLQLKGYRLQVSGNRLHVTGYRLQVSCKMYNEKSSLFLVHCITRRDCIFKIYNYLAPIRVPPLFTHHTPPQHTTPHYTTPHHTTPYHTFTDIFTENL